MHMSIVVWLVRMACGWWDVKGHEGGLRTSGGYNHTKPITPYGLVLGTLLEISAGSSVDSLLNMVMHTRILQGIPAAQIILGFTAVLWD